MTLHVDVVVVVVVVDDMVDVICSIIGVDATMTTMLP